MNWVIEFHPNAEQELKESHDWYEERQYGLGERFLSQVQKGIDKILKDPERFSKRKGNYREMAIDSFPFLIIYEVINERKIIFISYVFHTKRNPEIKYKR